MVLAAHDQVFSFYKLSFGDCLHARLCEEMRSTAAH